MRTLKHLIDCDRRHATMIDGTVAQHARRALRRVSQNLRVWRKWARCQRVSRTKNDDRRASERRADMSRPSVISHDQICSTEYRCHLVQICLTGEHDWLMSHATRHFFGDVDLIP